MFVLFVVLRDAYNSAICDVTLAVLGDFLLVHEKDGFGPGGQASDFLAK